MKDALTQSALWESSLSMLIAAARRQVKQAVSAIVGPYGLNAHQCWILLLLRDHGPMSLSELAGRMWMDHPTASRLVHALEASGLVVVRPDPSHGRKVRIGLNAVHSHVVEEIFSQVEVYRSRLECGLSEAEKSTLHAGLSKIIVNLAEILGETEREEAFRQAPLREVKAARGA